MDYRLVANVRTRKIWLFNMDNYNGCLQTAISTHFASIDTQNIFAWGVDLDNFATDLDNFIDFLQARGFDGKYTIEPIINELLILDKLRGGLFR